MIRLLSGALRELYMAHVVKSGYNKNNYSEKFRNHADRKRTVEEETMIDRFLKLVSSDDPEVLDIGCGDGYLYDTYLEDKCILTLIDISKKMINLAKKNVNDAYYICDDFLMHKFDSQFNGIVMFYSMFHIPLSRQEEALKKMYDLLLDNSVILMNVRKESSNGYVEQKNWCGSKMVWSYYSLFDFSRLCRKVGFDVSTYPSEDNKDYVWLILTKKWRY